jgi:hypothetical protein
VREWESAVNERMGGLKLCAETRNDVVRELASHFEEIYEDARERGAGEQQAREQALGSVRDWRRLARDVQHEKENFMTMTPFRRRVVMPGLVAFVFATIPLFVTNLMGLLKLESIFRLYKMDYGLHMAFNVPWLVALPVAGAVGAWMSWRNGGNGTQRLTAGIFPALTFAWAPLMGVATAVIWIVINLVAPQRTTDHAGLIEWGERILQFAVPWIIVPAISMTVGALPFLWLKPHAEDRPAKEAHA